MNNTMIRNNLINAIMQVNPGSREYDIDVMMVLKEAN